MIHILLHKPLGFSELGQRPNNEDCIFPPIEQQNTTPENTKTATPQNFFLVCDGVGGMAKGEVASQLLCETLASYFAQNPVKIVDANYINEGLAVVHRAFVNHEKENPTTEGMASTLALLAAHEGGITVAHVGDSRVYQLRNGQILHKTIDHSLVNQLLKEEIITPEEAIGHPQRNVIVRAVKAERKVKAEVSIITDLAVNDYFLLCTDGVLEHLTDEVLCTILSQNYSNEEKIEAIRAYGKDINQDNFSAYLLSIANITTEEMTREDKIKEISKKEGVFDKIKKWLNS